MTQYLSPELLPEYTEVKVFPAGWFEADATGYYVDEITVEKAYGDSGGRFSLAPPDDEALHRVQVGGHHFSRRDVSAFALRAAAVQPTKINAIFHSRPDKTRQMFGRVMDGLEVACGEILGDMELAQGIARAFIRKLFQLKSPTRQMLANYEAALTSLYAENHGNDYRKMLGMDINDYVKAFVISGEPEPLTLKKVWSSKDFQRTLGVASRSRLALGWFMRQHTEDHICQHGL